MGKVIVWKKDGLRLVLTAVEIFHVKIGYRRIVSHGHQLVIACLITSI